MCTKQEWKECAERRLTENLAYRVILTEIEGLLKHVQGSLPVDYQLLAQIKQKIDTAKEIGRVS